MCPLTFHEIINIVFLLHFCETGNRSASVLSLVHALLNGISNSNICVACQSRG